MLALLLLLLPLSNLSSNWTGAVVYLVVSKMLTRFVQFISSRHEHVLFIMNSCLDYDTIITHCSSLIFVLKHHMKYFNEMCKYSAKILNRFNDYHAYNIYNFSLKLLIVIFMRACHLGHNKN